MDKKKNLSNTSRWQKKYRIVCRNTMMRRLIDKNLNDDEYITDIEHLRKALEKIEKEFYSSNIKLEQIENSRHSKIILSKVDKFFSFRKKEIKP